MCLVGLKGPRASSISKIEYDNEPYGTTLEFVKDSINEHAIIIGFHIKYDLHWLRRYGCDVQKLKVWDVQLAHFILSGQSIPYPSLNDVGEHYGLGSKDETIAVEYWGKGIDTREIPLQTLTTYLQRDLELTEQCFLEQRKDFEDNPDLLRLFKLACLDLLVLQEMEWNGLIYDVEESEKLGQLVREKIAALDLSLSVLVDNFPLNWNSNDHVSAVVYGGSITVGERVLDGLYKTGKKAGQPKYRLVEKVTEFPRLITPPKRSELAKEGYWSTAEPILRQLRPKGKAKKIVDTILERSKLEKLVSSYYEGFPALIRTMNWEKNTLHGTLNQCVASTGRLSSTKPNQQNTPAEVDKLFRSRYDHEI